MFVCLFCLFDFFLNSQTLNLWTQPPGMDYLQPGRYSFPFSFTIPLNSATPPSFRERYGAIKYYLTAEVDRPGLRRNNRCYRPINIIDLVDTNNPQYLNEMTVRQSKTMCCMCCKSKPIVLTARIPASAWCPGEVVPVEVSVDNGSTKVMKGILAAIDRSVTFTARGSREYINDRLTSVSNDESIAPESNAQKTIYLRVPPCCPSFGLGSGRIIELEYALKVTLKLPAGSFNLHAKFPIVIGSIPHATPPLFREQKTRNLQGPTYTWCNADAIARAAEPETPRNPDSLPPPPDFVDYEGDDPEPQNMGGSINYVYFPMPDQYYSGVAAVTAAAAGPAYTSMNERTPLLGGSSAAAADAAAAAAINANTAAFNTAAAVNANAAAFAGADAATVAAINANTAAVSAINANAAAFAGAAAASSSVPPPPTGVSFNASYNGFSGNIFSAPSAFAPIPKDN